MAAMTNRGDDTFVAQLRQTSSAAACSSLPLLLSIVDELAIRVPRFTLYKLSHAGNVSAQIPTLTAPGKAVTLFAPSDSAIGAFQAALSGAHPTMSQDKMKCAHLKRLWWLF
jgi:hypothetical protein